MRKEIYEKLGIVDENSKLEKLDSLAGELCKVVDDSSSSQQDKEKVRKKLIGDYIGFKVNPVGTFFDTLNDYKRRSLIGAEPVLTVGTPNILKAVQDKFVQIVYADHTLDGDYLARRYQEILQRIKAEHRPSVQSDFTDANAAGH